MSRLILQLGKEAQLSDSPATAFSVITFCYHPGRPKPAGETMQQTDCLPVAADVLRRQRADRHSPHPANHNNDKKKQVHFLCPVLRTI